MVKITKELGVGKDGYQTGGVEYKEEVGSTPPPEAEPEIEKIVTGKANKDRLLTQKELDAAIEAAKYVDEEDEDRKREEQLMKEDNRRNLIEGEGGFNPDVEEGDTRVFCGVSEVLDGK